MNATRVTTGISAYAALDGKGKQPCSKGRCPFRSLAGLVKGQGLCPFHYAQFQWGTEWAEHVHPLYHEAREMRGDRPHA